MNPGDDPSPPPPSTGFDLIEVALKELEETGNSPTLERMSVEFMQKTRMATELPQDRAKIDQAVKAWLEALRAVQRLRKLPPAPPD